jgi:hypothetical protein
MVDNDRRVPAIGASVKAVPGLAEVIAAIAFWEGGQVHGGQSRGLMSVHVNAMQDTVFRQHQQMAIRCINGADVQDTGKTVQLRRLRWMSWHGRFIVWFRYDLQIDLPSADWPLFGVRGAIHQKMRGANAPPIYTNQNGKSAFLIFTIRPSS